ncbi:MAG: nucleotidyltransferase domain-containing protein [Thermoplasmataceae archaeon]
MDVVEKRVIQREAIVAEATAFASSLDFRVSAFLIGSYSRGDFNLWSDVDIVMISDFTGNILERLKKLDFPSGYEIIPLTFNEFRHMLSKKNPICMELKSYGVALRDDIRVTEYIAKLK